MTSTRTQSQQQNVEKALRIRIEELEAEVWQLQNLLAPESCSIPIAWKLTPSEAIVFSCLTAREIATNEMIYTALYPAGRDVFAGSKVIDVFICKIRKKCAKFGVVIECVWGRGYALHDRLRYRNNLMVQP